jgi:hypothetical protein
MRRLKTGETHVVAGESVSTDGTWSGSARRRRLQTSIIRALRSALQFTGHQGDHFGLFLFNPEETISELTTLILAF